MAEDMIARAVGAIAKRVGGTDAEYARDVLLAALDLTPDELEEIGRDLRWSNSYERMDGLRSVLIALKQRAQGEQRG